MADASKGAAFLDAQIAKKPKLLAPTSLKAELRSLWEKGLPPGDRTGWPSVDKHYTVLPGQFTVVTGWPGSGKSEWLDALLVNLCRQGWKIAMFSPENQPVAVHITKLLEKVIGKPFGRGPTERMTPDEVDKATDQIAQWFGFIEPPSEDPLTVQDVIEAAAPFLLTAQKRGLVIDPWNELEHWRPSNLSETEYISKTLTYVRNWARKTGVHVWIVAHPQKLRRESGGELPVPKPDMISGSQHWWNKADNAIAVWRDLSKPDSREVQIHVHKVRFKHVGRPGLVCLDYDRVTGRYFEQPAHVQAYAKRYAEEE